MFKTEKFIREVEARPPIYDVKSPGYSKRVVKTTCWNEVAETMYEGWQSMDDKEKAKKMKQLLRKWKAIRDNFLRDYKILKKYESGEITSKKKLYKFFNKLYFLMPNMKDGDIENPPSPGSLEEEEEQQDVLTEVINGLELDLNSDILVTTGVPGEGQSFQVIKRKKRLKLEADTNEHREERNSKLVMDIPYSSPAPRKERISDLYGNRAFMMSYAPIMDNLSQQQFLQIRKKITDLFSELD